MSSGKWQPFCLGLNVLNKEPYLVHGRTGFSAPSKLDDLTPYLFWRNICAWRRQLIPGKLAESMVLSLIANRRKTFVVQ